MNLLAALQGMGASRRCFVLLQCIQYPVLTWSVCIQSITIVYGLRFGDYSWTGRAATVLDN